MKGVTSLYRVGQLAYIKSAAPINRTAIGVGAALGGLGGLLLPAKSKGSRLKRALIGTLGGAAAGGLSSYAWNKYQASKPKPLNPKDAEWALECVGVGQDVIHSLHKEYAPEYSDLTFRIRNYGGDRRMYDLKIESALARASLGKETFADGSKRTPYRGYFLKSINDGTRGGYLVTAIDPASLTSTGPKQFWAISDRAPTPVKLNLPSGTEFNDSNVASAYSEFLRSMSK